MLGIGLAVAIVHSKLLSKSLMPWIIASQTIPILAIAPMVIVVLGSVGLTGLVPKSLISMYLCFFPVTIGMVKGLTSPDPMQLDLMRTYNASVSQVLWKLRFPASMPFLFASLKVAVAIALTGAIVGELPTGAQSGIGSRMLAGSYYGQTIQIWSALVAASAVAAALVYGVGGDRAHRQPADGSAGMKPSSLRDILAPALFGIAVLILWQATVRCFNVPFVMFPAPTDIWAKLIVSLPTLYADFVQTFIRAVIPGWIIGSLSGFLVALLCDRFAFLRRGLLPLGNLAAALPIVGVAPIMVMWFGFDWQSKAAMVVVMTFFPMLVNAVAGLQASGASGARPDAELWRQLVADAGQTATSRRHAFHFQRAQDQLDIGA